MVAKSLSKYFPPSMVTKLRNDISNFRQLPEESLFEAWERYKLSIDRCPNHNMLPVTQIDTFYNGLTLRHRDTINAAAGGTFMKRRPEECYDLIENMTAHHNDWDTSAQRGESSRSTTSSSPEIAALAQQMAELTKNVLRMSQSNQQVNVVNPSCETCGGPHQYFECQAAGGFTQGDVYATTGTYNAGGNSYQPQGNRNLLSYRSNNFLGPPGFNQPNNPSNQNFQNRNNQNQFQNRSNQGYQNQGFNQSNQCQNFSQGNQNQGFNQNQGQNFNQNQAQTNFNQNQKISATDDILRQHMIASDAKFHLLANQMTKMEKAFNERPQGALPSNTIPNPREDIKVITTRSGMTLAGPSVPPHNPSSSSKEVERDPETNIDQVHIPSSESTARVPSPIVQPAPVSKPNEIPERNPHQPHIPYPSSFAEALAHMPKYAKMLKDLLTNKEKLLELVNTPLNENCLVVLLRKLPEKLGDPGKFLIPYDFSELEECMALADLGASINLMPLYVWKNLMLPELV
ncbi:hypothetical protein Tco_1279700 [Tanacetum coccineum]